MLTFALPYPPPTLRPNAARRQHWATNGAVAARYKADCLILCRAAGVSKVDIRPHLTLTFCPSTKRRIDLDGDLSAFKAGCDAISIMLGVDDSLFSYSLFRGQVLPGGEVRVTITEREA